MNNSNNNSQLITNTLRSRYKSSVARLLVLFVAISSSSFASEHVTIDETAFEQCKVHFAHEAKEIGISSNTIENALQKAQFQSKVIEYDRNQPEFVRTFPDYFTKRVTNWRINNGRKLLTEHKQLLDSLNKRYGMPPHYLVSFWGLETNFGQYKGKMPIIGSLATLACDQRRQAFFTKELMQALKLIDRETLDPTKMVGSWAGAMGHTQFMPSAYIKYAVDGDNDGSIDLWNSIPDALTSAANFLQGLGWTPGYRWGREITLPADFDYSLIGRSTRQSLKQWHNMGVKKPDGGSVGELDIEASVLLPTGHQGPAFLIYENFGVIMKWNFSEFYAIAVGYLADQLVGGPKLQQKLPKIPNYRIEEMRVLQVNLNTLGFDVGEADGILGPATRKGIQHFQVANQLIADGFPTPQIFKAIESALPRDTTL